MCFDKFWDGGKLGWVVDVKSMIYGKLAKMSFQRFEWALQFFHIAYTYCIHLNLSCMKIEASGVRMVESVKFLKRKKLSLLVVLCNSIALPAVRPHENIKKHGWTFLEFYTMHCVILCGCIDISVMGRLKSHNLVF